MLNRTGKSLIEEFVNKYDQNEGGKAWTTVVTCFSVSVQQVVLACSMALPAAAAAAVVSNFGS